MKDQLVTGSYTKTAIYVPHTTQIIYYITVTLTVSLYFYMFEKNKV